MPGANWMGGKRNSARIRSKDFTKAHFGKRRIMNRTWTQPTTNEHNFSFAHAQREDYNAQTAVVHSTTTARYALAASSSSSPSTSSRKTSRVLSALDDLEPASFAAKRRRLLEAHDFIALPPRRKTLALDEIDKEFLHTSPHSPDRIPVFPPSPFPELHGFYEELSPSRSTWMSDVKSEPKRGRLDTDRYSGRSESSLPPSDSPEFSLLGTLSNGLRYSPEDEEYLRPSTDPHTPERPVGKYIPLAPPERPERVFGSNNTSSSPSCVPNIGDPEMEGSNVLSSAGFDTGDVFKVQGQDATMIKGRTLQEAWETLLHEMLCSDSSSSNAGLNPSVPEYGLPEGSSEHAGVDYRLGLIDHFLPPEHTSCDVSISSTFSRAPSSQDDTFICSPPNFTSSNMPTPVESEVNRDDRNYNPLPYDLSSEILEDGLRAFSASAILRNSIIRGQTAFPQACSPKDVNLNEEDFSLCPSLDGSLDDARHSTSPHWYPFRNHFNPHPTQTLSSRVSPTYSSGPRIGTPLQHALPERTEQFHTAHALASDLSPPSVIIEEESSDLDLDSYVSPFNSQGMKNFLDSKPTSPNVGAADQKQADHTIHSQMFPGPADRLAALEKSKSLFSTRRYGTTLDDLMAQDGKIIGRSLFLGSEDEDVYDELC